jgi:hypothetical protein
MTTKSTPQTSDDEDDLRGHLRERDEFQYTHLLSKAGEIRLFSLRPGKWDDDIEIRFSHSMLFQDGTNYDALSYAWGNAKPKKHIMVETHQGLKQWKHVTQNLEAALRHLRHRQQERMLWVDALCINQEDGSEEKGPQIQQMDLIYSKAQVVIVFLGEASDDSTMAMKFIKEVSDLSKLDQLTKDVAYRDQWKALGALMRRPWFNRRVSKNFFDIHSIGSRE